MPELQFRLISETVRENAIAAIRGAALTRDKPVVVKISPEKRSRTERQNAYLWGVVYRSLVAEDAGFFFNEATEAIMRQARIKPAEVVHEFCKGQFLSPVAVGAVLVPPSTADLSRTDFHDYVEAICRWAAFELGIVIPPPEYSGFADLVRDERQRGGR